GRVGLLSGRQLPPDAGRIAQKYLTEEAARAAAAGQLAGGQRPRHRQISVTHREVESVVTALRSPLHLCARGEQPSSRIEVVGVIRVYQGRLPRLLDRGYVSGS